MAPATLKIPLPPYQRSFEQTTVICTTYVVDERLPVETFQFKRAGDTSLLSGLDWMLLAKTVLPDANPLTAEERLAINEFFWSHFE